MRVCCIPSGTWVKTVQLGSQNACDNMIEIFAGANPAQPQITLSRSVGHIAGVAKIDKGNPADGGVVTLISYPLGPGKVIMSTGIDNKGRFDLSQVAPGHGEQQPAASIQRPPGRASAICVKHRASGVVSSR